MKTHEQLKLFTQNLQNAFLIEEDIPRQALPAGADQEKIQKEKPPGRESVLAFIYMPTARAAETQ